MKFLCLLLAIDGALAAAAAADRAHDSGCEKKLDQVCPGWRSESHVLCVACIDAQWSALEANCKTKAKAYGKCGKTPSPSPSPSPPGPSPHPVPKPLPRRPSPPTMATPSIVLVLTDDQDIELGSMNAMAFTRALGASGSNWTNFFAHTPVCCPSRSEIMTGRYFHSIRNGDPQTSGCMHVNASTGDTPSGDFATFAGALQRKGYATGVFGKYLNSGGMQKICAGIGGVESAAAAAAPPVTPLGWTEFMGACPDTCYTNCHYQHDGVDDVYDDAAYAKGSNYGTSVIGNASLAFVERAITANWPFFAEVASHAPHGPATPAPWYADLYADAKAPRTASWNVTSPTKHWVVATQPALTADYVRTHIDAFYQNRLRSLRSVDDIVAALHGAVQRAGRLDTTYFFFTSDHGLHMGQFCLGACKRMPYDTDIRIPMLIVGPGIAPRTVITAVAGTVDIAPTFLALAGVTGEEPVLALMDGKSLVPLLMGKQGLLQAPWRDAYLIEYIATSAVSGNPRTEHLKDNPNNTFIGLRISNSSMNAAYFEFTNYLSDWQWAASNFCEYYDLARDPAQLENGCDALDAAARTRLHEQLRVQYACAGASCA